MAVTSSTVEDTRQPDPQPQPEVWLTIRQAARQAQVSPKLLYSAVAARRLKAARLTARGDLRLCQRWLTEFMESRVGLQAPDVKRVHAKRTPRAEREAQKTAGRRK